MASQTQGIQQLLAAEKRAAEKVSEARKRKWKNIDFLLRRVFAQIYLATLLGVNIVKSFVCCLKYFATLNVDYSLSSRHYSKNFL